MNLVEPARRALIGALVGALAACLVLGLGLGPVLKNADMTTALTLGLFVGAIVGGLRQERWLAALCVALLGLHFFLANTATMARVARSWVRDDGPPAGQDAIVVLSAYLEPDSVLNGEGTERLLSGIELFRAGVAPRIVTTKLEVEEGGRLRTSTADQRRLLELGGITTGWTEIDSVASTRDEAVRSAARLIPMGVRRIVVVTSPFHTRRACATFEAVGFTVSCYPARERRTPTRLAINSAGRLAAFGEYVYERLGMIKYEWKGWIDRSARGR